MADKLQVRDEGDSKDLSRRELVKLSVAGALAASAGATSAEAVDVVETDVKITMPDGTCDAAFINPTKGSHPGVLVWPDAFGLRPAMRDIGKRIAVDGYSVLVPNPYYRAGKAATLGMSTSSFSFQNQDDMAKLRKLMSGMREPGTAERDA